jgi:hypothetical protein
MMPGDLVQHRWNFRNMIVLKIYGHPCNKSSNVSVLDPCDGIIQVQLSALKVISIGDDK